MSSETWGKAPPGTATVRPSSARATRASRAGSASFPASRANGQGGAQVQQQVDGHLPVDPGQQSTDGIDGGSVPLSRQCGRGHRPHSRSGGRSPPRPSAVPRAARARSPGAASRSVRCTPPGSRRAPVSARPRRTGRRSSPDGAGARLSRGAVPFASGPSPVPPEPLLGRVGGSKGARPPPVCPGGDAREPSGHAAGHGQNGNVERFGHRGFPSALPARFPFSSGSVPENPDNAGRRRPPYIAARHCRYRKALRLSDFPRSGYPAPVYGPRGAAPAGRVRRGALLLQGRPGQSRVRAPQALGEAASSPASFRSTTGEANMPVTYGPSGCCSPVSRVTPRRCTGARQSGRPRSMARPAPREVCS